MARHKQELERQQEPTTAHIATTRPHYHFTTGEPCECKFTKHLDNIYTSKIPTCEACGDALFHGKCKRCDWGHWNDAMSDADANPVDPTRDMKPSIQS